MVGFQWVDAAPQGLDDPELATLLGAVWEGDELVTYDLLALRHRFDHYVDDFCQDPD
jgi:hypothetical protein